VKYSRGEGVPENVVEAYKWFDLAAVRRYGKAERAKRNLEKTMTREQSTEAWKLADEWKPTQRP